MKADTSVMKNVLTTAIFETFEKMFFIFLEPAGQVPENFDMGAAVQFEGIVDGQLEIFFPRSLAVAMVRNMLNCDENGVTDRDLEDCTKEAANVVCGGFLQRVDKQKAFDLSIPVFRPAAGGIQGRLSGADNAVRVDFDSDYGALSVLMTLAVN